MGRPARAIVAVWATLALLAGGVAGLDVARAAALSTARHTVRCHWVKATKKRRRHRVCVRVKKRHKTTNKPVSARTAPTAAAPPPPAVAPQAPAGTSAPALPDPLAGVAAPAPAPTSAPAPARLQVTAREFTLTLSRPTVTAGALALELVNRGEDPHDLHVRPAAGGPDVLAIDPTDGFAGLASASGTLPAGSYVLYCSLPGHEALGMHAVLTVQ